MSEARETNGFLLGGRVAYSQPRDGFRSGIEPVLLAAAVPARAQERVLEAGCGAGAALLCLAARLPGISGCGIERDPALAALAARNIAANGWAARLAILAGDITAPPIAGESFDHVCANPPWHDDAATPSPHPSRRAAKIAAADLLARWVAALAARLRRRGSATLILPAAQLGRALAAIAAAGLGAARVLPLWPRAGRPARLMLLQARKGAAGGEQILPGLVLHDEAGRFTDAAEAVLRHGAGLVLG
ncbi:MAG: methyltransferase [Acidibrevibacterium sp.]|uniref:tRNA1(Val) (adenine(37)-N6)-methyltransferase n=1 Tax=Acidibrevibacterium fodinaquatile TaxID=1969806 RepID=UPI0023A8DB9E|nr:methyltransferase domain-containing protein [Acidibrevibacterium fodinaquatile]MCA7119602.1 methyltransferase [Acidibrevibacterium fodinaquatile]